MAWGVHVRAWSRWCGENRSPSKFCIQWNFYFFHNNSINKIQWSTIMQSMEKYVVYNLFLWKVILEFAQLFNQWKSVLCRICSYKNYFWICICFKYFNKLMKFYHLLKNTFKNPVSSKINLSYTDFYSNFNFKLYEI